MASKRKQQIFLNQQDQPDVALTTGNVIGAATGKYYAVDPKMKFGVATLQRPVSRGTLTPTQGITGLRTADFNFGIEIMGGTGSIGGLSPLDLPFRMSGLRREACQKIYIDAVASGHFIHGENVSIGGVANSGIVVGNVYNGHAAMYIAQANGLSAAATVAADGDAIVGATSGASTTADGSGTANGALGYWPVTTPIIRLTIGTLADALAVGDVLRGVTSGAIGIVTAAASTGSNVFVYITSAGGTWSTSEVVARITPNADANVGSTTAVLQLHAPNCGGALTNDGVYEVASHLRSNVAMRFATGELPLATFSAKGAYYSVEDGGNISGISYPTVIPAAFLAAAFRIGASDAAALSEFTDPCIGTIDFDLGNELSQRLCANSDSGVLGFEITARNPRLTIDPELRPEAFFPIMGKFLGNLNVCVEWVAQPVLKSSRSGRTFRFQVPNASVQDSDTGDRSNVLNRQLQLQPNTGSSTGASVEHDNDIIIVHDFAVNSTTGL